MTEAVQPIPQPVPERQTFIDEPVSDVGDLSQRQLMRIRFAQKQAGDGRSDWHHPDLYHRVPGRIHCPQLVPVPGYGIYLWSAQPDHL